MKIGFISTIGGAHSWPGSEETWGGVADLALDSGLDVSVHAAEKTVQSERVYSMRRRGASVFSRADLGPMKRRLATRGLWSRFRGFFNQNLDAVCVSMGGIADCIWIPDLMNSLQASGTPYVVIVQANSEGLVGAEVERHQLRAFYGQAKMVVFVSNHNLKLAERQLAWQFPAAYVIPNPLRLATPSPVPWPKDDKVWQLAVVARLEVVDKQQDHLLEALSDAAWQTRNWRLTFYGSGADESHIRRLINFFGLQGRVELGGFVKDFRDIWARHHLHVLPSRREGMPLALIESMACGRPAVVTRAGGSPELIDDGESGFVCPGMHPEILHETLQRAWDQWERWREMGEAAFVKVNRVVSDDWAEQILGILQQAAGVTA